MAYTDAGTGAKLNTVKQARKMANLLNGKIVTSAATQSAAGLMSAADKTKLDGVATGATANSASNTTPKANGTAAVGSETTYARGDHVHPSQTTVSGNAGTATTLKTARTIDGVSFNGSAAISHYGTCSTAAATVGKEVACTGFTLVTGAWVAVRFTVTNTGAVASLTLNVNSTGAKAIKYRNGNLSSAGVLAANRTYLFVYDGTYYQLIGDLDSNTTYSAATQSAAGLMSAADKKKLDGIATGATANSASSTTPKANGTAAIGSETTYARGDHVHPSQTTVSGNAGSATKLANARAIDGVSFDGSAAISHYGECSTAAATVGKEVSCTGFTLVTGAWVSVRFTVTNTGAVANLTLNVNGTGAKSIKYRNGNLPSTGTLAAGRTYLFVYDGTYYQLIGDLDTNTTYSAATQSAAGLMSADDKKKLDGVATGANAYTHPTSSGNKHIPSGGSSGQILRWSADGTAAWGADNNTTYSAATQSAAGLMSASDKTKTDNLNIAYGTCSTAAATAAKEITITSSGGWSLATGAIICVKFSATNTASNPTFNVNGTGAKSVWYNTGVLTTGSLGYAGTANRPMLFSYDGTQFVFLGWSLDANDNTVPSAYCNTAAATAAKSATCSSYVLLAKSMIHVILTNANTAASALTFNINSKGAKPIYINGAASSASNYTLPAGSYLVYYDGTNYYFRTDGLITAAGFIGSGTNLTNLNASNLSSGTVPAARLPAASTSAQGAMSAADKSKLDGIATGANAYTHPTSAGNKHIPSGGSSGQILRWSADGTAAWGADNNTTYSAATQSAAGLMSANDKKKLDGVNIATDAEFEEMLVDLGFPAS